MTLSKCYRFVEIRPGVLALRPVPASGPQAVRFIAATKCIARELYGPGMAGDAVVTELPAGELLFQHSDPRVNRHRIREVACEWREEQRLREKLRLNKLPEKEDFEADFAQINELAEPLTLMFCPLDMWCLVAAIQLASRHPEFQGPIRQIVVDIAKILQARLSVTPALRALLEAGWEVDI